MKVALTTLGCKLNYAETSTYERGFVAHGLEVVPWNAVADIYVINTCAVTETAEKKSRNLMRRAHKLAPDALIIVTGCYAELKKDKLYDIEGVSRVFGASDKTHLVEETLAMVDPTVMPGPDRASEETLPAFSSGERTRSFLKVQDGCNNFCAYCTVPFARGRSRNIPVCEVVKQAEQIAAQGIKEVVLTGVNTGDFGRTSGESFLDLLKALDKVDGIERYRISSIEPNLITEEIVDWIASGTKFQRHFHIPLQVGSDVLLKKVGRRYDTALFASRIDYIRQAMERPGEPKVFFGIDVIVGLPGETEELFMETYNFLKDRIKPAYLHVFPYSRRPGTRAAAMPDQVQDSLKTERVARLEALCEDLHAAFVAANKGLPERVLWESSVKGGLMFGYTGNYIRVEKPYDPALVNQLEDIII
ncbi:MAG: tRNA (N(6)-L-threonylcarbamoyladenosine(37)-C(2))-methylthiotransferase MtaB [Bacteroidales bacterium]|nr:tRNA (N(6)-L-threonylcarbamoyladenosine(37)-C(2))-methylthiotransferase MtaB [Bacteroidales bacterium]MBR4686883.1 tRNA (N(6)-L-threonylcarbamoyladenosine(37)-C(2))-methylthiotransferase MtaB [Bacteroidales bacterium]